MSRRRTKPEDIRDPERYFNRYIAMEVWKDQQKQAEYEEAFCSLEEKLEMSGSGGHLLLATNEDGHELELQLSERSLLAWIDYIECPQLHAAIRKMTLEQKALLTLRYKLCLSQRETAEVLKTTQTSVLRCEQKLLKQLRSELCK